MKNKWIIISLFVAMFKKITHPCLAPLVKVRIGMSLPSGAFLNNLEHFARIVRRNCSFP